MKKLWKEMRDFMQMLWQTKKLLLPLIGIDAVLSGIMPFWKLFFSAQILNHAIAMDYDECIKSIVMLLGGNFVIAVVKNVTSYMVSTLKYACREGIYLRVIRKLFAVEYDMYENSEMVERVRHLYGQEGNIGDVGNQIVFFHQIIIHICTLLCSVAGVIFFTAKTHAKESNLFTSPFGTIMLISLYALLLYIVKKINDRHQIHIKTMNDHIMHHEAVAGYMDDLMSNEKNGRDIRVFHMQDFLLNMKNRYEASSLEKQQKYTNARGRSNAAGSFMMHMAALVAYIFIGARAYYGAIEIGDVLMYVGVFQWISTSLEELFSYSGYFLLFAEYYRAYEDFLQQPDMAYDGTLPIEKRDDGEYEFEFHNVSFSYPETEVEVLHNVSLKFNIGETMAIVGRNGAGKSTIVKLLCRLYEPTSGYITLNGVDIRKYKYAEYVKAFSVVFQDFHLFSYGLDENVASGESIDHELLLDTLEKVNLDERVMQMEQKEKSRLYNNNGAGIDISGGEAQRLAIARALYKDAPFVILDEPTAALDPIAEAEIYENFNQLVERKTAIYISHRMSSCKFCDRIVVLDQGSISETGTHEELIQKNGIYSELYHVQAAHYA